MFNFFSNERMKYCLLNIVRRIQRFIRNNEDFIFFDRDVLIFVFAVSCGVLILTTIYLSILE